MTRTVVRLVSANSRNLSTMSNTTLRMVNPNKTMTTNQPSSFNAPTRHLRNRRRRHPSPTAAANGTSHAQVQVRSRIPEPLKADPIPHCLEVGLTATIMPPQDRKGYRNPLTRPCPTEITRVSATPFGVLKTVYFATLRSITRVDRPLPARMDKLCER